MNKEHLSKTKRTAVALSAIVLLLSLVSCGKSKFKAGTYTASVYGNNDYINVQVVLTKNKIASIDVTKHSETRFLGDAAIDTIAKDIVEYQTLNVDSVSGATVTSAAFKSAVYQCIKQANGDTASLNAPVPPKGTKNDNVTTESADIIIVGAGGAGLAAAVTAAQAGAQVIVIEKMPVIGGNTVRCASAFNTADPQRQAALPMTDTLKAAVVKAVGEKPANAAHAKLINDVKAKYNAYLASGSQTLFDCPEWHALQTYNGGDKVGHVDLIRTYTENTFDTLHWMEGLGTPFRSKVSQGAGALWQRTHQVDAPAGTGLIGPLYDEAIKHNIPIITNMRAERIIVENGKAIGVRAIDRFGSTYDYRGTKGIIIATGGYSNNKEMRQKSNPSLTPDMVSTNQPGTTGDGIIMAVAIGAATTGMDYVQTYPLATPGSGTLQGRARKMSGLDNVIDVNKEGKRFVNEDARRDAFVAAIKKQTDAICYDINDASIVEEKNSFNENVETLVSLGRIYKADTLAGLEEQLKMPAGSLQATVAEYNKMVEAKNDPVFGRKLFADKIEKAPFYATPRAPSIHHTMGGLYIATNAQVMDVNGKPIDGLYAAGEVVGGIHGSNRLGGNATADVLTFGRIAARSILAK
ncbi:flavocytochrome c [Treponema socranskii subsp. socranskii VPI DR56BR1116 = ATCC 35536]|uniref:Urocanate reductase n=1 Tax=Treponema socranskii subsp. socranskii VPI DR56BR1116 = ATCC 35536 TaxID=1125725 RepID=U1GQP3_TRESO|nr:flavocytochrome c [Treponema socranskii]ERF60305.1 flavocytochrome c [Treponema socranskii subsp. socranskii VPI DR56BR1116 = ATCC 35536]ERJ99413.1 flavocytochrome c [Treponema socranskii subsp. socranskii VPI DR56BR1116 = ATCC 35536]